MRKNSRIWVTALALAAAMAFSLTGCGDARNQETETETETETVTEPITEKITETEPVTEKMTETESETETETETEKELTPEEEKASEEELKGNKTMYAVDDINVRTEPSTEADVISSFDQGEQVTVSAETPNWYKIEKDGYSGYVYKEGLSEDKIDPKPDEERARILEEQGYGGSSVDLEYNVQTYAESFPLILASNANLRTAPSENGDVLSTLSGDTRVTAVGETANWYKVEYDGVTGFISKSLVK